MKINSSYSKGYRSWISGYVVYIHFSLKKTSKIGKKQKKTEKTCFFGGFFGLLGFFLPIPMHDEKNTENKFSLLLTTHVFI